MRRSSKRDALVFLAYAAISFGYFGARLLPHPGRVMVGTAQDPYIFVWSFAWWPHALLHGTNPFVTHALYAPQGINLTWTTAVPGLALAFAPLTLAAGPVVSFNAAAIALPALSAWTAYRLCAYLTQSLWASLVGGYLFGFSSFVLAAQLQAHFHLTGAFLLPVVALVLVRFLRGELTPRGLAWRIGLLVAAELTISTEVTVTLTLSLVVALLLAAAIMRTPIRDAFAPLVAGYVLAAVVTAPFVVFLLLGFHGSGFAGAELSNTDLANFVVPTAQNAFLGSTFRSVQAHFHEVEAGAYLGVPVLVIVALYVWRARRSRATWFLVAALLLAALGTLGDVLLVDGHRVVTLPWTYARHVPILDNIRPTRFALYLWLTAAVVVALWIAGTRGRIYARPYLLPALAVAALVPAVWHDDYRQHPQRWAFFAQPCAQQHETIAAFPWADTGAFMLAQAEHGFRFRLAGGYLTPLARGAKPVSSFDRDPTVQYLDFLSDRAVPTKTRLLAFAGTHGVARILTVSDDGTVRITPPCGRPPLTTRDLTPEIESVAKDDAEGQTTGWCLGTNYYALPRELAPAGILAGARHADLIEGQGLGCSPPHGYTRHGFATADMGVPPNTYPYYAPKS